MFAVEGAELHIALNDAVEVDLLRLEVVESGYCQKLGICRGFDVNLPCLAFGRQAICLKDIFAHRLEAIPCPGRAATTAWADGL